MTNIEEGSSSHEVSNDQEISEVETKGVLPGDKALQNLLDCVVRSNDRKAKFSPIYMVPSKLRDVNPSSFTPRVVSIGPLHTKLENLKLMENKKATYPSQLLDEVGSPPGETLINCVQKVTGSIENIRSYYFEMKPFTDDELIQMMILDGCFILQFIYNLSKTGNVVSNNPLRSRNIALDLVLLENQIPFFVLQDIYDLTLKKLQQKHTLTTLLSKLLELVNPFEQPLNVDPNVGTKKTHHILGLLHKVYKPNFDAPKKSIIPRAYSTVDLDEVGVKISPNKNLIWPMAIEFESSMFWGKPTLKIPVVRIDNFFEVVLRNLIAYEQYSFVHNYVRSYAMALDMLIATPENIGKLEKSVDEYSSVQQELLGQKY
ncbi:hypothetical protein QVD17_27044 [Tagetes erecta]|uniref:Uncharacterized protein n=1 Tax=Tagetes erecta TaxID=13708 RepID=A0AAD8KA63_TARER|nr:hypothetical protein QVD17_27044 [Tagetes erecta]